MPVTYPRTTGPADLFQTEPGTFAPIDDTTGRVAYTPDWIAPARAAQWFRQLHGGIAWRSQRRMMYERMLDVPRLTAHFRLDDPALPSPLGEIAAGVRASAGALFTSVGLNLYRDRQDSVAPHSDHLDEIVRGQPIALLSLGAMRTMTIRAKHPPRRVLRLELESGSLLLMDYAIQLHYDHAIPKQRAAVGPRISAAFRCSLDE
ncbi:MAG: alpha-ketoglutarate-dependent dioxygenase AlkB [Rhodanobacteraceae bacterium]